MNRLLMCLNQHEFITIRSAFTFYWDKSETSLIKTFPDLIHMKHESHSLQRVLVFWPAGGALHLHIQYGLLSYLIQLQFDSFQTYWF